MRALRIGNRSGGEAGREAAAALHLQDVRGRSGPARLAPLLHVRGLRRLLQDGRDAHGPEVLR